jgi:hypothetical protein
MSKQLFDDENEDKIEDPNLENLSVEDDDDSEFIPIKIQPKDKIFDNDYNTGNLDFEEYTNLPKVDSFYAEDNLRDCYDSYEYSRKMTLETLVDEYFAETEFGKVFASKKKIPKQILPQVFVSIKERFAGSDYSGSEIFTTIADYFGINYEILYENIPSIYRAELVRELDEKYGVLRRRGVKKLF